MSNKIQDVKAMVVGLKGKYSFPVKAKITKRILNDRHIQGYTVSLDSGEEFNLMMWDLTNCIKAGIFVFENATMSKTRWGYGNLKGKGCSLSKLPAINIDTSEYFPPHTF